MDTNVGVDTNMNTTMDTTRTRPPCSQWCLLSIAKAEGASHPNNPQAVGSAAALTQLLPALHALSVRRSQCLLIFLTERCREVEMMDMDR